MSVELTAEELKLVIRALNGLSIRMNDKGQSKAAADVDAVKSKLEGR